MGDSGDLQDLFETLLGSSNVYFQPPSSLQLAYPCIVFERTEIKTKFADNISYGNDKIYTVTIMYRDPNSGLPDKIAALPKCRFDKHFVAANLYHDVFTINY